MQIKVEVTGLDRLLGALRDYPAISEPIIQRALAASAAEVQKHATRGIIPWVTGNLVHSFQPVIGRLFAIVHPTAKYAIYVHEGTRPHVIRSKGPWQLRSKDGRTFGRSVNHPGTKPNRFLPKMLEKAQRDIDAHFKTALEKITSAIADKVE
jgi:hypothetical protein